jgi:hypothetical protein
MNGATTRAFTELLVNQTTRHHVRDMCAVNDAHGSKTAQRCDAATIKTSLADERRRAHVSRRQDTFATSRDECFLNDEGLQCGGCGTRVEAVLKQKSRKKFSARAKSLVNFY